MTVGPVPCTVVQSFSAREAAWATTSFGAPLSARLRFWGTAAVVGAAVLATALILVRDASGYWLAVIAAAPLYIAYRTNVLSASRLEMSRRHFEELAELHLSTVEALALAIDAKDQTATAHIRRVQQYAAAVAQAMGMSPQEVQGVRTAALLHDIGKLAVPEHILSKPGPLTEEEFRKVQIHPQIGAEIIAAVPFPYAVAPLCEGGSASSSFGASSSDRSRSENTLSAPVIALWSKVKNRRTRVLIREHREPFLVDSVLECLLSGPDDHLDDVFRGSASGCHNSPDILEHRFALPFDIVRELSGSRLHSKDAARH